MDPIVSFTHRGGPIGIESGQRVWGDVSRQPQDRLIHYPQRHLGTGHRTARTIFDHNRYIHFAPRLESLVLRRNFDGQLARFRGDREVQIRRGESRTLTVPPRGLPHNGDRRSNRRYQLLGDRLLQNRTTALQSKPLLTQNPIAVPNDQPLPFGKRSHHQNAGGFSRLILLLIGHHDQLFLVHLVPTRKCPTSLPECVFALVKPTFPISYNGSNAIGPSITGGKTDLRGRLGRGDGLSLHPHFFLLISTPQAVVILQLQKLQVQRHSGKDPSVDIGHHHRKFEIALILRKALLGSQAHVPFAGMEQKRCARGLLLPIHICHRGRDSYAGRSRRPHLGEVHGQLVSPVGVGIAGVLKTRSVLPCGSFVPPRTQVPPRPPFSESEIAPSWR